MILHQINMKLASNIKKKNLKYDILPSYLKKNLINDK